MQEILFIIAAACLVLVWKSWQRQREDRSNISRVQQNEREQIKAPPSLHPLIDLDRCIGCGSCVNACPEHGVLGLIQMRAVLLQPDHCVGHGKCETACPMGAISLVLGTSDNGVEIPVTNENFQTRVPGVYIAGELGGIGLIRNSILQGIQCIDAIAANRTHSSAEHDVIIVGCGPAGLGATLQAATKRLRYLTLEQYDVGGTILNFPKRKLVMTAPVNLPGYGKIQFRDILKEDLLAEWYRIVQKTGVKIKTRCRVEKILRRPEGLLEVMTTSGKYTASNVILALGRGGTPRKLGVPGEELPRVSYRLQDPDEFRGRKCLVVGGGDSAIECALMLAEAGAKVSFSYRQKSFGRAKPRNRQRIEEAISKRVIKAYLPSNVKEIRPEGVRLESEGREFAIPNDDVIIMAGGVLPVDFLKDIGIEMRTLRGEPLPRALKGSTAN